MSKYFCCIIKKYNYVYICLLCGIELTDKQQILLLFLYNNIYLYLANDFQIRVYRILIGIVVNSNVTFSLNFCTKIMQIVHFVLVVINKANPFCIHICKGFWIRVRYFYFTNFSFCSKKAFSA